jgi:hypothetical protein
MSMMLPLITALACLAALQATASARYLDHPDLPPFSASVPDGDDFRRKLDDSAVVRKRSASASGWAPSEIRVDQFMHKLRSRVYNHRDKHSVPDGGDNLFRLSRSVAALNSDLDNHQEQSRLEDLLSDAILENYIRRQMSAAGGALDGSHVRSHAWSEPEIDEIRRVAAVKDDDDFLSSADVGAFIERGAAKRTTGTVVRSPRELHPVYLGMGQNAANAALSTYASLLADDKRRENLEQQSNPVRFIGKKR